jgi:hypothetical protein
MGAFVERGKGIAAFSSRREIWKSSFQRLCDVNIPVSGIELAVAMSATYGGDNAVWDNHWCHNATLKAITS